MSATDDPPKTEEAEAEETEAGAEKPSTSGADATGGFVGEYTTPEGLTVTTFFFCFDFFFNKTFKIMNKRIKITNDKE